MFSLQVVYIDVGIADEFMNLNQKYKRTFAFALQIARIFLILLRTV